MKVNETMEERMATAEDFTKALCALVRENLVGLVQETGEREFVFALPGDVKKFRVCVQ